MLTCKLLLRHRCTLFFELVCFAEDSKVSRVVNEGEGQVPREVSVRVLVVGDGGAQSSWRWRLRVLKVKPGARGGAGGRASAGVVPGAYEYCTN